MITVEAKKLVQSGVNRVGNIAYRFQCDSSNGDLVKLFVEVIATEDVKSEDGSTYQVDSHKGYISLEHGQQSMNLVQSESKNMMQHFAAFDEILDFFTKPEEAVEVETKSAKK